MAANAQSPHVLIIGAGLGGLTLAQCLRKQGISFEIFERDMNNSSRRQGWAIGLHTVLDDLQELVPPGLLDLREAVHHLSPLKLNTQLCLYFEGTDMRVGIQDTPETPVLRANRPKLREWLGTDISIQWNKRLCKINNASQDKIAVSFEDGSTAVGDILIGADGVKSIVREHLLQQPNDKTLRMVPVLIIIGELTLSGDAFEHQLSLGHSCWIAGSSNFHHRLFVGLRQVSQDGKSGEYYWLYMENDSNIDQADHWVRSASREEKLAYVKQNIASFDARHQEIVDLTPAKAIYDKIFVYWDAELPVLPSGRITLLGDAAHPMTPFRGEGGVHAMRDALILGKVLGQVKAGDSLGLIQAVEKYHSDMLARGVEAVRSSRGGHTRSTKGQSKVIGWGHTAVPIPHETISLSSLG